MRHQWKLLLPALVLAVGPIGCDEDSSKPLDCAWLEGDNCWKQMMRRANECAFPKEADGVLSEDGKTCSLEDGPTVHFEDPIVLPYDFDTAEPWNFTIQRDGKDCLTFEENEGSGATSIRFTVGDATFQEDVAGLGVTITCPDGESYRTGNGMALLECEGDFGGLPGTSSGGGTRSIGFSFLGGEDGIQDMFSCRRAEDQ